MQTMHDFIREVSQTKTAMPCVDQVHLKRHIMRKHSNESTVADCRKQFDSLGGATVGCLSSTTPQWITERWRVHFGVIIRKKSS